MTKFRATITRFLRRLASWIEPNKDALLNVAARLIDVQETTKASGEAKRHQVYAALIKAFPLESKRDLAFAIEQVLQER